MKRNFNRRFTFFITDNSSVSIFDNFIDQTFEKIVVIYFLFGELLFKRIVKVYFPFGIGFSTTAQINKSQNKMPNVSLRAIHLFHSIKKRHTKITKPVVPVGSRKNFAEHPLILARFRKIKNVSCQWIHAINRITCCNLN